MSTTPRSSGHSHNIKKNTSISLLGLLIVINYATAIDYAAYRKDPIPSGTSRQSARTTREILEKLNLANSKLIPSLQDATEHFLHYGALLRTQILDTFGKLVYDHYDDFGMSQIDALYRIYRETLERKYNIFEIVPSILLNPDTRPTKICSHINKHINTCLKESSKICMNVKIHDEPHNDNVSISALNITRRIYRIGKIKRYYPHGFSLKCVLYHLRAGRLRFTSSLFSGLIHNIQYDNFDDKVRTAERELVIYLESSMGKLMTKKLEKSEINGKSIGHLLKNYLENGEKLFPVKIGNYAAYLSRHVVREIEAVSKNIELLGTVYDNSTINLKYLFQLILPNDSVDLDIIEARDYLFDLLVKEKIIERYLRVEKYQQTGPDQLLMEILGQLRDINFAKNLVTSLHAHAHFWHKSHMIENINELLELFDAYENLRGIDEFNELVGIIDRIKNYLQDSRNVTFELLCTRPRECLRIGLEIVAICPLINNETNRAIKLFIDRTSCGNSCLIRDSSFNNKNETCKKSRVSQEIESTTVFSNESDKKVVKIVETKNIENSDENNVTLIDSTRELRDEVMSSVTISSSNSTNYEADYDKNEMSEMENSEENTTTISQDDTETSETENSEENTTTISQDDTESSEMENSEENTTTISQDDTESSETENSEENTTTISQDDTESSEMENSEENTTTISQDDTESSETENSEENTTTISQDDTESSETENSEENTTTISQDDTESSEMENSEENTTTISQDDTESSETENSEENTTTISRDDTESSETENSEENTTTISRDDTESSETENSEENTTTISRDDTESSETENSEENTTTISQDDTENSASILSEETTEKNTILLDSLSETNEADDKKEELTENSCNGTNCSENDKCTGNNCKIQCEGDDCNVTASLENCVGRRCIENSEKTSQSSKITMENCQDSNCEVKTEKVTCTGPNCLKDSNKIANECETSNCEENSRLIECEGENCSENNCENGNCSKNSESENCVGRRCIDNSEKTSQSSKITMENCQDSNCEVKTEKVTCTGPNCLKDSNKIANECETSNCEENSRLIECEGENCSENNCEDGNCSKNSESNDECDDCEENSTTLNPCQGSDCSESVTSFIEEIQCRGFDCPVKNCTGQECGENEIKICQGSDCSQINCTGNKCPVNDVFRECEGPDCLENLSLNSTSMNECNSRDCSMEKSKENCEGSDCSGSKSEGEETCEGSKCSDSSGGQSHCENGDCRKSDKREEKEKEKEQKEEQVEEEEEDCEGSGCTTDENEIKAECKDDNCLGRTIEQDCKDADCPIDEKNVKENCQGANCSQEPFKETLIPCKGENCSVMREICIDENCTTNPPTTTEKTEQNKETTTLSSSTTIIVNKTTRPKTFCPKSDPHYKRKLHRLQKIRLIDALSSTRRSSYEIFNSFFKSSAKKKRKIADKSELKTIITNKTSEKTKNGKKTDVIRNNREKNPVLQVLGHVADSSRRSISKIKEIEKKIKKIDTSNSYEIDKVSKNSSNRTKLKNKKNNISNDLSMKKFANSSSDGAAILSTKIIEKELKEFGGRNARKVMRKMEIYDDENAENIGDSSLRERTSARGSVGASSSNSRMSKIYEEKERETTRLGNKRRKLVIKGRPKKRNKNKNWHRKLKSFQSGRSSAEGDMTKIIIYKEGDEDENGEDSSLGESTSHQGSVKLVSIKNHFPEIHETREKQTSGSRGKKNKWIVKTSVRRSKKYQHPKLTSFQLDSDENSRLEEIIFNKGNFTAASRKNRKSKNDETKKRKNIRKTVESTKFIIDEPMRIIKKYQHPKLKSFQLETDEDSRLKEIIFDQGNFTTASGKNRKSKNDETKRRKNIRKESETRKLVIDSSVTKKPRRPMWKSFQPGRSSVEGDMTKMIIYGEDDEDENDEDSRLEEIIFDEGNFTAASRKKRKSKNDETNKRKTVRKKIETTKFIIDEPMRIKKEYQHPKLKNFQLETDEDSRLEEIIFDQGNFTTASGKNRKSKNDETKKRKNIGKRARQED